MLLNKIMLKCLFSQGLVREGYTQAAGRTGCTHHKVASLYHAQARETWDVPRKRKRLFGLAETNYKQALSYFRDGEKVC